MDDADEMVTIASVYVRPQLAAMLAVLNGNGIETGEVGSGHVAVHWAIAIGLGGVHIRVPRGDAADARRLLEGMEEWTFRRGVFTERRLVDLLLVLLLFTWGSVPPPPRIQASFPPVAAARS
jgi:hypothetical protein